jgi:tetratricopeptide (TPR) repeat protein
MAQMQAALGLWVPSAQSWRDAAQVLSYLDQAAAFSLMRAPAEVRDSLRDVLRAPPVELSARRILSSLELRWRAPREAWSALADLPATDSTVVAWSGFARDAESTESWLVARDAHVAVATARPGEWEHRTRAATAALNGGDPQSVLEVLRPLEATRDSAVFSAVALLRIKAYGLLGRPAEIGMLLADARIAEDSEALRQGRLALAWSWIRVGQLKRAREALTLAGEDSEESERIAAWLALYEGDLATARKGLRRTDGSSGDAVTAMALLARTRVDSAPSVGRAFLALAGADTAGAARQFEEVSATLPDAAPLLLGLSARLFVARDTTKAVALWRRIVDEHGTSPEAAEADLEWARVLRRAGDKDAALARLEHLILTYPASALVPQARREIDVLRGAVPSNGDET